jgi:hypothetical protein
MDPVLERFGAAISDRYRLERELGRGGMATVFLADDIRHRRSVAIKVLDPRLAASLGPGRFLREIEIAARLVHPHILGLLDSGEAEGLLYYVMPYVSGDSLRARLTREGELPVDAVVRVLREVLDALAYAHGQGIVHRDVKPENILFVGEHVQVADFGVAKALDAAGSSSALTSAGLAVGTAAYMAPEQAAGDPELDHRVDIYAVGLVAYEMLAGSVPREGVTFDRIRPAVPPALAAVVARCLEKRPADRFQSCEEVMRQLELALEPGSENATAIRGPREIETASFRLTEEICRRLDRSSFDPRMIGDRLEYLDNRVPSDVLLCCFPACGLGGEEFAPVLRATRYRAMALTPLGFEQHRERRFPLSLEDHLVLAREWLRGMVAEAKPRVVVAVGFSSGADFALRLAAAVDPVSPIELHGCLSLGCNLSLETCFVTRVLAKLESGKDADTLAALRSVGASSASLDEWIDVHDYLVEIARKFRGGLEPLRVVARDVSRPFEAGPLAPFVRWHLGATRQGRSLRCVFDDSTVYHELIRELLLRNIEEKILGDRYEGDSIVIEPGAGHFDLLEPERVERHLETLIDRIRRRAV